MFEKIRADGRAQWRVLFDHFAELPYGELVPYQTLLELLETTDIRKVHAAAHQCIKKLRMTKKRSLTAEPGRGYRILLPSEHENQSGDLQRQGRRRYKEALEVLHATDVAALSNAERTRHDDLVKHNGLLVQHLEYQERARKGVVRLTKTPKS